MASEQEGGDIAATEHAVFLSYASEDAEVAGRICSDLCAAGIEVWFDRSELRGGDEWDSAIRGKIKACALFIPVISANSQARAEGYFRLEWKLAVDRSFLMAQDRPFLVPVVIDATRDAEARVPDRFREVQWTRLASGKTSTAFIEHVRLLLASTSGRSVTAISTRLSPPDAASSFGPVTARWRWPLIAGLAAVAIAAGIVAVNQLPFVKRSAEAGASSSGPVSMAPTAVAVGEVAASPGKSIAVLPFVDLSEKHDQEYFSDGLAEELLDLLSKTPGLRVIARTSSFYFKGKQASLPEIAKTLNVTNLLEGSVRRSGNRLRVTTQLIRADTGEHLWSDTYDRDLKDLFQVQDDIADAVVKALQTTLLVSSPESRTKNMQAYTLFLQGRSLANQSSGTDARRAAQVLRRAVDLDPSYAAAWAALAKVLFELSTYIDSGQDVDADMRSARIAVERAIELDPADASAYYLRATVKIVYDHDPKGAIADIDSARHAEPHLTKPTELVLVTGCIAGPCFEQHIREISRDIELDPLNAYIIQTRGWAYWLAGNFTAASADLQRALDLSPGFDTANFMISCILLLEHRLPEALKAAQAETNSLVRKEAVALVYFAMGKRAEAETMLNDLLANNATDGPLNIAELYAYVGNKSAALDWLERDYQSHRSGVITLGVDPFFQPLRSEPRFIALLKNIGMANHSAP